MQSQVLVTGAAANEVSYDASIDRRVTKLKKLTSSAALDYSCNTKLTGNR
jgi:hypothetical protein